MTPRPIGLQSQIWNNNLRSLLLIGTYPFVLAGLVWAVTLLAGAFLMPGAAGVDSSVIWAQGNRFALGVLAEWWPTILAVAAIWFIVAYFFQGRMVRALSHARPVTRQDEPALYNLLENLCISRGMKTPQINIIETDALNAFASGIDDASYTVTVTRGLMDALDRDELEAVLGHELTHIINRDVRLLIVSVIFTGMIGFFAQMCWSAVRYNLYVPAHSQNGRRDMRFVAVILAVGAVLWVGYMATILTRFALSRRREYMADAGSVTLTKKPEAMMTALMRIAGHDRVPAMADDIALMCIENTQPFMGMFATHPPIADRIAAIAAATGTPVPESLPPRPVPRAEAETPPLSHRNNPWRRGRNPWRRG
jgi:heat shock protein HtpX